MLYRILHFFISKIHVPAVSRHHRRGCGAAMREVEMDVVVVVVGGEEEIVVEEEREGETIRDHKKYLSNCRNS